MSWPDLTVVPEGDATRLAWKSGPGLLNQPVRFIGSGDAYLPTQEVVAGLSRFINSVVDRLHEAQLETPLAKEWYAVRASDEAETLFNQSAARLGLDPYAIDDDLAQRIVELSEQLDTPLLEEFLDSVDPARLEVALRWWERAQSLAQHTFATSVPVTDVFSQALGSTLVAARPFERGYERARMARELIGLPAYDRVDMDSLVTKATLGQPAAGLEGLAYLLPLGALTLVLPPEPLTTGAERFAQARALGLILSGHRREYILDPAGTELMKESRAFAAEFLAPADGIARYLAEAPAATDQALASIAERFGTSSWLIRHQYENQLERRL